MAYGRREGFSYADGVPLKLSDRLRPPAQIVFPCLNIEAPNLLENEYDFSVEKKALHQFERHILAKEAQEKAKVDKVAHDIEQFAQNPLDTGQNQPSKNEPTAVKSITSSSKDSTTCNKLRSEKAIHPAWPSATILNPQPLVKESLDTITSLPAKPINLADFESQSSSPFDMMELQTLNDLEELNTVFRGMAVIAPASSDPESSPTMLNTYPKEAYHPPNGYQIPPDTRHYPDSSPIDKHQSLYNGHEANKNLAHGYVSPTQNDWEEFPRLKSSKSTPDVRDEMIQEKNWTRSQTPPPHLSVQMTPPREQGLGPSSYHTGRGGRSSSVCYPPSASQSPPTPFATSDVPVVQSPEAQEIIVVENLPNPYSELEEDQQQFSATVAQMGFTLDRVARTVKHLGTDEKKVVDHLCHVQSLEESGYEGNDAETALHLYDYNVQEAKRFLDLLKQFQDLGFQKNAARKALIRHKNDRDRALDSLLLS